VIEHVEDYAVDPLELNAMLTGTAWHALMERYGDKKTTEVAVCGTLAGVTVRGKADKLSEQSVCDHKHVNDAKYIKQDGVKPEHVAQLSIYAELAEQSGNVRPVRGVIWYHTSKSGKDALIPIKTELMPIDEALAHQPYGGAYTVAELYAQADAGFSTGDWRALPLAGQTQKFGYKVACDYCAVRSICMTAENGAPF
jgi:hypothetical protein